MMRHPLSASGRPGSPRLLLALALAGLLLLGGCARQDSTERSTTDRAGSTPRPAIAPTAAGGIAGVPQTPAPAVDARERERLEALLKRAAPTSADFPPSYVASPIAYQSPQELAGLDPDPRAALDRYNDWGLVLVGESSFIAPPADTLPADGRLRRAVATGFAFRNEEGPRKQLADLDRWVPDTAQRAISNLTAGPKVEQVTNLGLGDQTLAWRAAGPLRDAPAQEAVAWVIATRRGPVTSVLLVDGVGPATDATARDLARRLDQRLAAALSASP